MKSLARLRRSSKEPLHGKENEARKEGRQEERHEQPVQKEEVKGQSFRKEKVVIEIPSGPLTSTLKPPSDSSQKPGLPPAIRQAPGASGLAQDTRTKVSAVPLNSTSVHVGHPMKDRPNKDMTAAQIQSRHNVRIIDQNRDNAQKFAYLVDCSCGYQNRLHTEHEARSAADMHANRTHFTKVG